MDSGGSPDSCIYEEELRDLLTYRCTLTGKKRCPPFSKENLGPNKVTRNLGSNTSWVFTLQCRQGVSSIHTGKSVYIFIYTAWMKTWHRSCACIQLHFMTFWFSILVCIWMCIFWVLLPSNKEKLATMGTKSMWKLPHSGSYAATIEKQKLTWFCSQCFCQSVGKKHYLQLCL